VERDDILAVDSRDGPMRRNTDISFHIHSYSYSYSYIRLKRVDKTQLLHSITIVHVYTLPN